MRLVGGKMTHDKSSSHLEKIGRYGMLVPIICFMGYPLVWMILCSLKTNLEVFVNPWGFPSKFLYKNWEQAWVVGRLGRYYLNSIVVTVASVCLVLVVSTPAAFAFARLKFKARDFFLYLFLMGLVLAPILVLIPLYKLMRDIKLLNTYAGLILPYTGWGLALSIYLLRSFFLAIPEELQDAARIDGCSVFGIFWRIMLPLIKPALLTVAMINAINYWNELLLALIFMQKTEMRTLPAGLIFFSGQYVTNYSLVFAGLSIAIFPILIVYFMFQRRVIAGMLIGALK